MRVYLERCRHLGQALAILLMCLALGCNSSQTDDTELPPESYVPKLNASTPPGPAPTNMVWIPGGEFWMGCAHPAMADARPVHLVYVDGFWMDRTEVTNEQFARFIAEAGYVTVAEKPPNVELVNRERITELSPELWKNSERTELHPFSYGFVAPPADVPLTGDPYQWWRPIPGANWRRPEGYDSHIEGREKHPVVHVSWTDAIAYCNWLQAKTGQRHRLPTEAEWEFAARGGLDRQLYTWGNEQRPGGKWLANIWQGQFPRENTGEDGFKGTAPAGSFAPNGYGLVDMSGNVWEWTNDWYRPDYYRPRKANNPPGPLDSYDPNEPGAPKRVQRGGSFMCSDLYCIRYMPGARGKGAVDSGAAHLGFRCVCSAK